MIEFLTDMLQKLLNCIKNKKIHIISDFNNAKNVQFHPFVTHIFYICVNGRLYTDKKVSIILFLRLDISIPFYNRFSHLMPSSNILFKVFIISCL